MSRVQSEYDPEAEESRERKRLESRAAKLDPADVDKLRHLLAVDQQTVATVYSKMAESTSWWHLLRRRTLMKIAKDAGRYAVQVEGIDAVQALIFIDNSPGAVEARHLRSKKRAETNAFARNALNEDQLIMGSSAPSIQESPEHSFGMDSTPVSDQLDPEQLPSELQSPDQLSPQSGNGE